MSEELTLYLVAGLIACAALMLVFFLFSLASEAKVSRSAMAKRIEKVQGDQSMLFPAVEKLGVAGMLLRFLGQFMGPSSEGEHAEYRLRLVRAGFYSPNAVAVYWGIRMALAVLFAGLAHIAPVKWPDFLLSISFGPLVMGLLFGFYLPQIVLDKLVASRMQACTRELPHVLDLLVVCVEAGMSFDLAINRIIPSIRTTAPRMAKELRILSLESLAGKARHTCLTNLAKRVDIPSMQNLVTLILQAERFGTSVGKALRVASDTLRTRRYQAAEEKAGKLPVTMMVPLGVFILPALLFVIIGPAIIRILATLRGGV